MSAKARRVIESLFATYREDPDQLPPNTLRPDADVFRALCDYLASLTDREALEEHRRLFDPSVTT